MSNPAFERILVTGGTGFIGRYVVNLLISDGFHPLVTIYNDTAKSEPDSLLNVDLVEIDLTEKSKTDDLIDSYKPQIVIHLAGATGHADPTGKNCHDVNFTATIDLLKALDRNGVTRVVMLGTAAEYGGQPIPFREEMPARPISQYAISKAKANQFALNMHAASGFPVTILRVFTAYGYGQPDTMFLSQLITNALLNRYFIMSDGLQKRDFVYVEDVAAAIKASMTAENAVGRIINIGTGQAVVLKHLARTVWNLCGADSHLLDIGSRGKTGDDAFDTEADISLAGQILKWRPKARILNESGDSPALTETISKMKSDPKLSGRLSVNKRTLV